MKILVLTFYYYPDLCAGSFRASSIVKGLEERLEVGQIDIVTTSPNRYKSYKITAPEFEDHGKSKIKRIPVPTHQSGMVDQAWAFKNFAWGALKETKGQEYDLVFATTSRLMTGLLGYIIAKKLKKTRYYLDIRDIFTDTMENILKSKIWFPIIQCLKVFEKRMVVSADKVNLISPGFTSYFRNIDKEKDFSFFTNGIDKEFEDFDFSFDYNKLNSKKKKVLYAGNIGDGQGLHRILPQAAKKLEKDYDFFVIGDGGARYLLEEEAQKHNLENFKIIHPMNRKELKKYYSSADILFVHLNQYKAFEKVIPSKLFEYGATGKPILAGVGGYPKKFIEENIENSAVFKPCDANDLLIKIKQLKLMSVNREEFIKKYSTGKIIQKMTDEIMTYAREGCSHG